MNALIPPCEVIPNLMLIGAWGIAVAMFIATVSAAHEPVKPWDWSQPYRRQKPANTIEGALSFIAGAFLAAYAISFAVNHPLCG